MLRLLTRVAFESAQWCQSVPAACPIGQGAGANSGHSRTGLTPRRLRRQVENDEYSAFIRRILRAYRRRVGDGDIEALALMPGLAEEIDTAIAETVKDLRVYGYSWAKIGSQLGITRQAPSSAGAHPDPTEPDRAGI